MVYGGQTAECPECGEEIEISKSEFRYGKLSHNRDCPWLEVDRYEGTLEVAESD